MKHEYTSHIAWTGNRGKGTENYSGYDRTWDIAVPGKEVIHCSNDPILGGDPAKMNPEDLLLSSLAACHMLWYLHLASSEGLTVTSYEDRPLGVGEVEPSGAGRFVAATLRPCVILRSGDDLELAATIHHRIHEVCFIARSVNFSVACEPRIAAEDQLNRL